MNVQRFQNFDKGLVTDRPADQLPVNALADCSNIEVLPGAGIRAARGRVRHATITSSVGTRNMGWYQGGSDTYGKIVVAQGTNVRVSTDSAQTSFTALNTTVHATNPVRMAQYGDSLYLVDGEGPVKRFAGFDSSTTSWTSKITGGFGTQGPRSMCVSTAGNVWVCDWGSNHIHKYTIDGLGVWTLAGSYTGTSSIYRPRACCEVTLGATKYIAVLNEYATTAPKDYHIVLLHEDTGGLYGKFAQHAAYADGVATLYHPYAMAVESGCTLHVADRGGTAARIVVIAYPNYDRQYSAKGTAPGQINLPTAMTIASDGGTQYTYVAESGYITKFRTSNGTLVSRWGVTGNMDGEFDRAYGLCASTTQIVVTQVSPTNPKVQTFTPNGVFVSSTGSAGTEAGQFVSPYAVAFDSTGALVVADMGTGTGRIQVQTTTAGSAYDVWALTDEPAPTVAPGLSAAHITGTLVDLINGTYDFKYSFLTRPYADFVEGAASPQATISITGPNDTFYVTVYPTSDLVAGDIIRVYARPPTSPDADYYLVAQQTHNGTSDSYVVTLSNTEQNGIVPMGADVLIDYQNRPPTGAQIVLKVGTRMLYTRGNRLYISNANDPTRVPYSDSFDETGPQYGGYIDVGNGTPITGMGLLGSEVIVFKSNGMWRLVADPNLPNFGLYHLTSDVGCLKHETIASVESGLVWQGNGTVWAMAVNTITDLVPKNIGKALQGELVTYNAHMLKAFAAYDAAKRFYYLTVPTYTWGTQSALAYTFRFQMAPGCWTKMYPQPGGALGYFASAATPGLYATDGYVSSGTTLLWRMDTTGQVQNFSTAASFTYYATLPSMALPAAVEKDVRQATVFGSGAGAQKALTSELRINQSATASASGTITLSNPAGGVGNGTWHLPSLAGVNEWQLILAGTQNTATDPTDDIRQIDVQYMVRGMYR